MQKRSELKVRAASRVMGRSLSKKHGLLTMTPLAAQTINQDKVRV